MNTSTSVQTMLADSVQDFFARHCDLQVVRHIEAGGSAAALWQQVLDAGYADALVPEDQGGAGLSLWEAGPIFFGSGGHVLPLPLGATMVVRAGLAAQGLEAPAGPITIAPGATWQADGSIQIPSLPWALSAQWVLVSQAQTDWLLPLAAAQCTPSGTPGRLAASVHWEALPAQALHWGRQSEGAVDWCTLAAALVSAQMAGAMARVMEMTIAYANERVQFGKPIGRQQALQQQISVLAELVFACRSAAELGLAPPSGQTWHAHALRGAVAKARTSEAVPSVTSIAHAVHGAIGISEEYDLHMLTRHLHDWRMQYGSEGHWQARLGAALLQDQQSTARFIQQHVAANG